MHATLQQVAMAALLPPPLQSRHAQPVMALLPPCICNLVRLVQLRAYTSLTCAFAEPRALRLRMAAGSSPDESLCRRFDVILVLRSGTLGL